MIDQSGVIHVHSTFSDGTGDWKEIAELAAKYQLDYLIMTDHNTLEPFHRGYEGFYGDCLVLAQTEINDQEDKNHFIALNVTKDIPSLCDTEISLEEVRKQNGFAIIAHPFEHRHELKYPAYPWNRWDLKVEGLELWNQLSSWKEALTKWNKIWRVVKPNMTLRYPPKEAIAKWDELNQTQEVIGIFGIDAHALVHKVKGLFPITIFPYKVHFQSLRNIVLVPDFLKNNSLEEAKTMIYDAYRKGRLHCVNHRIGDGIGFRFWAEHDKKELVLWPGDTIEFETGWILTAKSPDRCKICLIRDGERVQEGNGHELKYKVEKHGVYRIETYKKDRAWLFTNPIRLRKS
ncbi:MAG: histidinol-phosphatase [bacterium]|nr:histidinol-phosphatase [bacterium]